MRIKMLRPLATLYGGFRPGTVIDIPEVMAKKWCKIGYAEETDEAASFVVKPHTQKAIPAMAQVAVKPIRKGMAWCTHCEMLHRANSKIGKSHAKYQ